MAPSITTLEHGLSVIPISSVKLPKKAPTQIPQEFVDLSLTLCESHILEAAKSQYLEYLGPELAQELDIESILVVCWLLVLNGFSPVRTTYLEFHPQSNLCYIDDERQGVNSSALEFSSERPLKDLVRDFCLIKAGIPTDPDDGSAVDGRNHFLSSAFRYAGDRPTLQEAPLSANSKIPKSKLMLNVTNNNGKLHASLAFSSEISKDFATSLLHSLNKIVASIYRSPTTSLGDLDLCSDLDLILLQKFTKEVSEPHEVLLHDMALEHARLTPNAPAICSWDGNFTYRELDDVTSRLALRLTNIGVGPETFVLSCFKKSSFAIIARLAILKAGGAYISIDASDPPIFLDSVINRVNAKVMLTSPEFVSEYATLIPDVISISGEMLKELPMGSFSSTVKPNNACLILFTSGSTGQPKGIIQEHRSYAVAVRDYNKALGLGRHSRVFQFDDYAFDISNNDYLTALAAGGCCCVPTPDKALSSLIENIKLTKANMSFMTPTVAIQLNPKTLPSLELLCIGGEPMSNDLLMKWGPHVKLVNQYGMGEAATFCAYNDNPKAGHNAVVGKSGSGAIWIANTSSPERPVPIGAVGEILIEGPHLSRGYLDDLCQKPDVGFLNEVPRWIADLHSSRASSSRIYRSGDLGRYRHDGTVEHMGRKDTLLKLDGNRVESTEVEYILRKSLSPGDLTVVDMLGEIDGSDAPILVAYIYLGENPANLLPGISDHEMSFLPITNRVRVNSLVETMQKEVDSTLPKHMMPSLFLLVDRIPRTRSNKLDRRKLHQIAQKWYKENRDM
ncbi:AMP-dependent synthetase/ligase [Penicillium frequentans]|uniref:AMP-dependent synthetase/ligase n=1 Tax=Penicillium frequentans TaxID=3151616 RepID=A0AAD6D742_9EURO|nr:AMP-dependent synthetase/ligase [Penicillium glabrum]